MNEEKENILKQCTGQTKSTTKNECSHFILLLVKVLCLFSLIRSKKKRKQQKKSMNTRPLVQSLE